MNYYFDGNKREGTILSIINSLSTLRGIKSVQRYVPSIKDYMAVPVDMCPYVSVIALLPQPQDEEQIICPQNVLQCSMDIQIWFFGIDTTEPDSAISYWYEILLNRLYTDPTFDGNVESCLIRPNPDTRINPPYFAFMFDIETTIILNTFNDDLLYMP